MNQRAVFCALNRALKGWMLGSYSVLCCSLGAVVLSQKKNEVLGCFYCWVKSMQVKPSEPSGSKHLENNLVAVTSRVQLWGGGAERGSFASVT